VCKSASVILRSRAAEGGEHVESAVAKCEIDERGHRDAWAESKIGSHAVAGKN
jgi:hypothetical protein